MNQRKAKHARNCLSIRITKQKEAWETFQKEGFTEKEEDGQPLKIRNKYINVNTVGNFI